MPDIFEIERISKKVEASPFPLNLIDGFRAFLIFVRDKIRY